MALAIQTERVAGGTPVARCELWPPVEYWCADAKRRGVAPSPTCACTWARSLLPAASTAGPARPWPCSRRSSGHSRSEEHTSELQSRLHLVCRLLLEKKKKKNRIDY